MVETIKCVEVINIHSIQHVDAQQVYIKLNELAEAVSALQAKELVPAPNTCMLSASQIVEALESIKDWLEPGRKIVEGDRVGAVTEIKDLIQQLQHA